MAGKKIVGTSLQENFGIWGLANAISSIFKKYFPPEETITIESKKRLFKSVYICRKLFQCLLGLQKPNTMLSKG